MNIQVNPHDLRWCPSKVYTAADKLVKLKKDKDPWEVFEYIVRVWQSTNPSEYDSFLYTLDETKGTRKITNIGNKQFSGVSIDKETGGTLRYLLDIPTKVIYLIKRLYPNINLDKEFYTKWAKKFPKMVIEETR